MPQHVDVDFERKAGAFADALDQAIDGIRREWGAALGFEYVATGCVALQLAKGAQLVAADRMGCRLAILGPPHVQGGCAIKFDLRPFQIANLNGTQPVPVGHEDQSRVTMPIAAFAGSLDKLFNLGRSQVLPRAQFAIAGARRNPSLCAN